MADTRHVARAKKAAKRGGKKKAAKRAPRGTSPRPAKTRTKARATRPEGPASRLGGLAEALLAVSKWLSAEKVAFAIIGGVAASLHGRPRVTKDVDVVIHVSDDSWGALLRGAARRGIRPRVDDAIAFARVTRVLLLVHRPSSIEVDVSCGMLPFEHDLIARAQTRTIGRLRIPLATPEDIIVMKALALRPRDVADIEGIVESVADLDVARIRRVVAELSAALETEDHVAALDSILRRMGR